jgi:copper chaperone CopZ
MARVAHLEIGGMNAVHAVRAVYTAFAGVRGVEWAEVSLGKAEVEHDGTVTREMLEEAIATAGFTLTGFREERRLPLR